MLSLNKRMKKGPTLFFESPRALIKILSRILSMSILDNPLSLARMQQQMLCPCTAHYESTLLKDNNKKSFFGLVVFGIRYLAGNCSFATIPLTFFAVNALRQTFSTPQWRSVRCTLTNTYSFILSSWS